MGCWNETCGISNLPIHTGEKVCLFILGPTSNNGLAGEGYYADDLFVQLGFPIFGVYDDYGGIEYVEENSLMEDYLKEKIETMYFDKNSEEFLPYTWKSMEDFLGNLTRHELYVNIPRYRKVGAGYASITEYTKLDFMLVHYDLYERLIEDVKERFPYSHNETYETLIRKKIEQCIYECNDKRDEAKYFGIPFTREFWTYFRYSNDSLWNTWDYFVNLLETDDVGKEKYNTIVDGILDYYMWHRVMDLMRKGFHLYTGAGSQASEYKLHKILAQYIVEKCADWEESYSDSDEYPKDKLLEETLYFFD